MWQNWQHIISEEAKKYGYGEDRILRESKIKAAAEAWFNSLPKECLAELKQRVGKAIAAANTKNVPLLPTDLMNIQLILKAHKVKPLLGSMQASMTAVETMMQPDRLESLELESVEDENIITEGYERVVINTLEDAGFKRGDAWFDDGILYVAKRNLIAAAKTALQDNRNIYKLPKIKLNPDMKESIEAVGNTDKGGYSHWTNRTKVIRTFSWRHKETGRSVSSGGAVPWLTPAEKSEWGEHAYNGYFVFYNTVNGTTFGGMYDTEQKAQAALDNAKRDHQKEVAKYVTAPQVRKRIQELENEIVGIRNSPSMAGGAVRMKRLEDEIKRLKQQLRSLGAKRESVEVDGDTINEGFRPEDYGYRVDEDSMRKDGKTFVIYKLSYSGGSIRFMDGRMGTVISRFATVREALAETKRLAKKDYPNAQIESIEAQGDTIAEAKKKLTPEQKAALKAYKLSCDMRDRDDITPDAYRHYEKRAKADAEACRKLGLGKEDGVYESVEVAEASGHWLRNSKRSVLGAFTHATTGVRFDYRMSDDEYGKKHGLPHEVHVGANSASGETRPALVKGTVCIIGVDEGADGKPVVEKWKIKQHVIYPIHHFRVDEKPEKWTKWRAKSMRGEEFESENTSLIEATYNKAKAKNRKKIVDGIKKVLNGEMSKQDFMRLIGAESEDHPMVVKTMAKMKDLVAKRTTIQLRAK